MDVETHSGVPKTILDLLDNGLQLQVHCRYFNDKIQYKPNNKVVNHTKVNVHKYDFYLLFIIIIL